MDLDKYVEQYYNLSRKEIERIRDCTFHQELFEPKLSRIHYDRESVKINGMQALRPGPLVHVISVSIQPKNDQDKPFAIYGSIRVENFDNIYGVTLEHDLYKRDRNVAQVLDTSGTLTLTGPDYMCDPDHAFIPMFRNRINVELFDEDDNIFAQECFSLDDTEIQGGYEQVKSMCIPCKQGSLVLEYIAIPFGISCRLEIKFYNGKVSKNYDSINVNGKIVASYVNTYGNYASEECVLFEKHSNAFERVEIDRGKMQLSRCWVALPAYSSLVVGVDLSEFDTGRKIVNDSVKFLPQPGGMPGDVFMLDDLFIQVLAAWFPPSPLRPHKGNYFYSPEKVPFNVSSYLSPTIQDRHKEENDMELEDKKSQEIATEDVKEMDTGEDDESYSSDESISNLHISWDLRPHKRPLQPSPALEIFSVFIGRENSKTLQIHGSIVLSNEEISCYIFKRDENDAFCLGEHRDSTPILDGFRVYDDSNDLKMDFDLKDVDGNLAIKGYRYWDASVPNSYYIFNRDADKQMCAFIQGENGFAAVHYSIFSAAFAANIKIFLNPKTKSAANVYPKVCGSLISQYRYYYYSSRYNKDYYRSVLFMKTRDDSVQVNGDGSVPLSRSLVIVPAYSALIINVNLSAGVSSDKFSGVVEIEIGESGKTLEIGDCILLIEVDWCEVK